MWGEARRLIMGVEITNADSLPGRECLGQVGLHPLTLNQRAQADARLPAQHGLEILQRRAAQLLPAEPGE